MLRHASNSVGSTIPVLLLLATVFCLTHPYTGIRHDAILYTAQAIYNAHPQNFHHDLFFQFGSQDDWTLYGKLYSKLIEGMGIRDGNKIGLIAGQLLWWTGMWRISRKLLPAPWHWIALLFIAGMPPDYGEGFVFSYDEMFLTARLPAEALGLWALSFALDRRPIVAFAIAVAAMTLHPLIGAVGFATVLFCVIHRAPWWRLSAALLVLFALLQYFTPVGFAIHPFDAAWQQAIRSEVVFLFPSKWDLISWSKACWVIALPLIVASGETEDRKILWRALALIGIAGVSFAYVADIVGHDAMWIQLQLWRVLWLLTAMQWIAYLTLLHRERTTRPALIWILALCWMVLEIGGGCAALGIAVLAQSRCFDPSRQPMVFIQSRLPRYRLYLTILTIPALLFLALSQHAFSIVRAEYWAGSVRVDMPWIETGIHSRLMALLLAGLCLTYLLRDKRANAVFYVSLAALLAYAVANVDQRSPIAAAMEAQLDTPQRAPFVGRVTPGQMVYWDGLPEEIMYPWFLMKTASYFSEEQTSGIVFHRQTTFEALRRAAIIRQNDGSPAPAGPVSARDLLHRDLGTFKPLTQDGIVRVCRQPALDFVISPEHYVGISTDQRWWATPQQPYWLYDCRRINAMAGQANASGTQ